MCDLGVFASVAWVCFDCAVFKRQMSHGLPWPGKRSFGHRKKRLTYSLPRFVKALVARYKVSPLLTSLVLAWVCLFSWLGCVCICGLNAYALLCGSMAFVFVAWVCSCVCMVSVGLRVCGHGVFHDCFLSDVTTYTSLAGVTRYT